jgi:hypothetical protein
LRVIFLLLVLFSLTACSISDFKFSGFKTNLVAKISQGMSKKEVEERIGNERFLIEIPDATLMFYESGFVQFKKDKVVNVKNYTSDTDHHSYVRPKEGESILNSLAELGVPSYGGQKGNKWYLSYSDSFIFIDGWNIVSINENSYSPETIFSVKLTSYGKKNSELIKKYFLMPGNKKISPSDLEYKEVEMYVRHALEANGIPITNSIKDASYVVLINFGISDPKEDVEIVSSPVFVPQYQAAQTINVNNNYGAKLGSLQTQGSWGTSYAGQDTQTIKTVSYTRWLNIEAIDYKYYLKTKELNPVWKVVSSSVGPSEDLRIVVPALVLCSSRFTMKDSKRQMFFNLDGRSVSDFVVKSSFNSFSYDEKKGSK